MLTAADGGAAIDLCQRYQGKISLLITDIVMTHASGPQVYAQVSALMPDIAVLYMSGYTGETVLARGGREKGVAYLQKPFTPTRWRTRCERSWTRPCGSRRLAEGVCYTLRAL